MLIKIDKIAEHIMSLGYTDGNMDDSTLIRDRLVFGDLAPRELALPVTHAIRGLTDESTPNRIRDAVVRHLKVKGWAYPEAFFESPQVRCPATGNALHLIETHDDWCFDMSSDYIITYDGGCHHRGDSVFCGSGRTRVTDVTGWYPLDETTTIDDELYPDWYADERARGCPECGELTWHFNLTDNGVCRACESKNQDAQYLGGLAPVSFILESHNDNSSVSLRPQCRKPNRYGIELEICVDGIGEISNSRRRRQIVATHAYHATKCFPDNYVVAKRDGSLYDCGFELVTKPDTYARMHKTLAESLPKFSPLLNNGGESCEGEEIEAGLHINMERRGKSTFQQAKMLYFMFTPANEEFLVAVANRRSSHYAGFPGRARWNYIYRPPFNCGSTKYVAVHVKEKVLEFRLFSSFTHRALALSCLEFCEALSQFAKEASARSLLAPEFIQFVLATNSKAEPDDFSPSVFPHLAQRFRSPRFRSFLQNKQ